MNNSTLSRRDLLQYLSLGIASTTLSPHLLANTPARRWVALATWINYHDPENFSRFYEQSQVRVRPDTFSSDEEMFNALLQQPKYWDILLPTNYGFYQYLQENLIEPIDLNLLPNVDLSQLDERFAEKGILDGKLYGLPRTWGTTGYIINTKYLKQKPKTWKAFWELVKNEASGRTIVLDEPLTTIGFALRALGYDMTSADPAELAAAEKLLLEIKPHLHAITSDCRPLLTNESAWLSICWSGDAYQLQAESKHFEYILIEEASEIWCDFYVIPKDAPRREFAYQYLNFVSDPNISQYDLKASGYALCDKRVKTLLPQEILENPIMYTPPEATKNSLFFKNITPLKSEARIQIINKFKEA